MEQKAQAERRQPLRGHLGSSREAGSRKKEGRGRRASGEETRLVHCGRFPPVLGTDFRLLPLGSHFRLLTRVPFPSPTPLVERGEMALALELLVEAAHAEALGPVSLACPSVRGAAGQAAGQSPRTQ